MGYSENLQVAHRVANVASRSALDNLTNNQKDTLGIMAFTRIWSYSIPVAHALTLEDIGFDAMVEETEKAIALHIAGITSVPPQ